MVALVLDGLVGFPAGLSPTSFVSQFFSVGVPGWLVSHFLSFASQFFSFVSATTSFHLSPTSFHCLPGWVLVVGFRAGLSPTSFHLSPTSFHSPNSLLLGVLNALKNGRLGAGWSGRVPDRLVSHFLLFVSQFFSFVSQARCLWSGSRLACLPLPFICLPLLFICLPVLFICLPGWVLVVGFPAGLSPTSFHLSPTSFHLSSNSFHSPNSLLLGVLNALKNGRLGAGWSGRVPSRLVSHFLCLPVLFSRGSRLACLPLPFICLPILFICLRHYFLSFVSHFFSLSPRLGACGRVPGRLVSHFLSFVSHFFSFPKQFTVRGSQCFKEWSPWCWMVWSPKLGACGRVRGWLVSHFLSFVTHFFSFVSQFFSFVSQAGCLWSGSRLACLPLPFICLPLLFICLPILFICLPGWVLVVGFPAGLSPTSFHLSPTSFHLSPSSFNLSPRLGACGRVSGWLVSHFLSFVSHFFSFVCQGGCLWSGSRPACLPLPFPLLFICLPVLFIVSQAGCLWCWLVSHFLSYLPLLFICFPGWVLVVRFPAGLSPTSFHLSRTSFHLSGWVLWSGLRLACLPRAFICLPLLSFVSQFFSFLVSQAGCLWSGSRLACLALPFICLLLLFTCLLSFHLSPRLGACGQVPGRLVSHFLSHFFSFVSQFFSLSPHLSPTSFHLSFHLSPTSYHLSPRLGACGRVSGWLVSHFLSYVSHFFSFVSLGACGRVCGWLVSHVLSLVSHFFHLSPSSFHLSPTSFHSPNSLLLGVLNALKNGRLGAGWSGRVPSRLVSHFLCLPVLFSRGSRLACLPLPFICLPILFICLRHYFLSFVSHFFSLSPRLGACGRVPGRLVSHFLSFVSHFFSFPKQFTVRGSSIMFALEE